MKRKKKKKSKIKTKRKNKARKPKNRDEKEANNHKKYHSSRMTRECQNLLDLEKGRIDLIGLEE